MRLAPSGDVLGRIARLLEEGRYDHRIDVLFNNAAMAYFNWIEDITDEEWDRDRREEVDLVFYLTRAAWPHLKTSHGVIVNTGSLNGLLSFKTLPRWPTRQQRRASSP